MNKKEQHDLALLNPFNSVVECKKINENDSLLLGVKNDFHIPLSFISELCKKNYQLHTVDKMAYGGRAIDLHLINPVTGNYMSGSSSGTAINVFLGINDIGIGSDGGGSILAPSMALNLFGFISYLICEAEMNNYLKLSTDNIVFRPSLGFITADFTYLKKMINDTVKLNEIDFEPVILIADDDETDYPFKVDKINFPDKYGDRKPSIIFLEKTLKECDFIISLEGPVDEEGFGDSVFGHFDENTKLIQEKAKKGFIKVANMVKATAICIPTSRLGVGYVGICESKNDKISIMLKYMEKLVIKQDELVERYFRNKNTWFRKGFGERI